MKSGPNINWYLFTIFVTLMWGLQGLAIWIGFNLFLLAFSYLLIRYCYYKNYFIITSLLDTDFYKLAMQQVVFHHFPEAIVRYKFINRGEQKFPKDFHTFLTQQVHGMNWVQLTEEEAEWLNDNGFEESYIGWLSEYRFNPSQVIISQNNGDLEITIEGPWVETILWEVPLMAIISELYFKLTGQVLSKNDDVPYMQMAYKGAALANAGVKWIDFGTRRRYSKTIQDAVNANMQRHKGNFLGTSNPYFAMKYGLKAIGTFAHEAVMAMQAKYSLKEANRRWLEYWLNAWYRDSQMLIALTDTLTTEVFFRDFDKDMSEKYVGVRQDSGDPFEFGKKMLAHYKRFGIDPKTKKIVFSDGLTYTKAIRLHETFSKDINCVMGIGTNLTNDCGFKPLNMVIKLTQVDFGEGFKEVVKLSDDCGKHTGNPARIEEVKKELEMETCPTVFCEKDVLMTQSEKDRWENTVDIVTVLLTKEDTPEDKVKLEEELTELSDETIKRLAAKLASQVQQVIVSAAE